MKLYFIFAIIIAAMNNINCEAILNACTMVCPLVYAPLCASNGQCFQVFDNECALRNTNNCNDYTGPNFIATGTSTCPADASRCNLPI